MSPFTEAAPTRSTLVPAYIVLSYVSLLTTSLMVMVPSEFHDVLPILTSAVALVGVSYTPMSYSVFLKT